MPGHDHTHSLGDHDHNIRSASKSSLKVAFVLVSSFMLAEVIGGILANSLALLADAAHMITDAASIGLALLAMWIASRPATAKLTFGFHRVEVLAAVLNAMSLWLIAGWVFFEAYRRFTETPEVQGTLTLTVGAIGLLVNIAAALMLKRSAGESLNVEGAFLHVLGDLLGSVGVVAAGVVIIAFGWYIADPIFGVVIGVIILLTSTRLLWKTLHVLLEGTPGGMDIRQLCSELEQVEGVAEIHDLHVWSVTSGYAVLSAHVVRDARSPLSEEDIRSRLRGVASRRFGVNHLTVQIEAAPEECVEDHHVSHA